MWKLHMPRQVVGVIPVVKDFRHCAQPCPGEKRSILENFAGHPGSFGRRLIMDWMETRTWRFQWWTGIEAKIDFGYIEVKQSNESGKAKTYLSSIQATFVVLERLYKLIQTTTRCRSKCCYHNENDKENKHQDWYYITQHSTNGNHNKAKIR